MKRPQLVAYSTFYFIAMGALAASLVFAGTAGSLLLFLGNASLVVATQISLHSGPASKRKQRSLAIVLLILMACVVAALLVVWSGMLDYAPVRYGAAFTLVVYALAEWRKEVSKWDVT